MQDADTSKKGPGSLQRATLTTVCQRLLDVELRYGCAHDKGHYRINLQQGERADSPELETFPVRVKTTHIEPYVTLSRTWACFQVLFDHYTRGRDEAKAGSLDPEKMISDFLDAVIDSPRMSVVRDFLSSRELVAQDGKQFQAQLRRMWFDSHAHKECDNKPEDCHEPCGFERVFVGKGQDGEISAVHNWLQFHSLEHSGKLTLEEFIAPKSRAGSKEDTVDTGDLIIIACYHLEGQSRDVSSVWMGRSPEFEFALYTLCFVAGEATNVIELSTPTATYDVEIRCERLKSEYGDKVRSAFPVLLFKTMVGTRSQHQPQQPQAHQQSRPLPQIMQSCQAPLIFAPAQPAPSPDCLDFFAALFFINASSTRRTGKTSRLSCWSRNVAVMDDSGDLAFHTALFDGSRSKLDQQWYRWW